MTVVEFKKLTSEYFEQVAKFVSENKSERGVIIMANYEETGGENSTRGIAATPLVATYMIAAARKDDDLRPLFFVADAMGKLGM